MYKCNNCKNVFESAKVIKHVEKDEAWGHIQNIAIYEHVCPECRDDDYEEISVNDYINYLIFEEGLSKENARIEAYAMFGLEEDEEE